MTSAGGARDSDELRRILTVVAQEDDCYYYAPVVASPAPDHRHQHQLRQRHRHRHRHCVSALAESIRRLAIASGARAEETRRMHEVARTRTATATDCDEEAETAGGEVDTTSRKKRNGRQPRGEAAPFEARARRQETVAVSTEAETGQEATATGGHLAIHAIVREKAAAIDGSSTDIDDGADAPRRSCSPRGRIVSSSGGGVVVMEESTGNGPTSSTDMTSLSNRRRTPERKQRKPAVRRARCA
mmetsp:Transcript_19492/g.56075  ORF Transcript_19492/g.56075 Transcript_19492/m.56075 type:complete len:244 (+) Transcript_19492:199-930(+)